MGPIVYMSVKEENHWSSCRQIEKTLRALYQDLFQDIRIFEVSLTSATEWNNIASRINELSPRAIILADQRFKLDLWSSILKKQLSVSCQWFIYTYGCILTRANELSEMSRTLSGEELFVLTASEAHQKILASFFSPSSSVLKIPFPVPVIAEVKREKPIREKFNLPLGTKIFLSTSRISMNKNVHHLVRLFSMYAMSRPDSVLIICGGIDLESTLSFNETAELFNLELQKANEVGAKIIYLGHIPSSELSHLMRESDVLMSLSTNIGEDFGLSLLEAVFFGLPVLASAWGGQRDFDRFNNVRLIPIIHNEQGLGLETEDIFKGMDELKRTGKDQAITNDEVKADILKMFKSQMPKHQKMTVKFHSYAKRLLFYSPFSPNSFHEEFKEYVHPYWEH